MGLGFRVKAMGLGFVRVKAMGLGFRVKATGFGFRVFGVSEVWFRF